MKRKLLWRFRKGSGANPIQALDCGCKYYVYDKTKTLIWRCEKHIPERAEE